MFFDRKMHCKQRGGGTKIVAGTLPGVEVERHSGKVFQRRQNLQQILKKDFMMVSGKVKTIVHKTKLIM